MGVYLYPAKNQSNQTIVLSSGLGGHAHFWQPQIAVLTEHFQVLCYDHEGIAYDSPILAEHYQMQHLAMQLIAILQHYQVQHCYFVGHALGAFIGIEVARLAPDYIDKLFLINAWDRLDAHTQKCFSSRQALLQYAGVEAYVKAQALFLYPPAWISKNAQMLREQEDQLIAQFTPKENVLKRLNALQQYQPEHVLPQVFQPTLVLVNQDDFLVPWQRGVGLFKLLANADLCIMAEGAHASTVTQSHLVNNYILDFFVSKQL